MAGTSNRVAAEAWLQSRENVTALVRTYGYGIIVNRAFHTETPFLIGPRALDKDVEIGTQIMDGLIEIGYLRRLEEYERSAPQALTPSFGGEVVAVTAKAYAAEPMVPAALDLFSIWMLANNVTPDNQHEVTKSSIDKCLAWAGIPAFWFIQAGREGYLKRLLSLGDVDFRPHPFCTVMVHSNRLTEAVDKLTEENETLLTEIASIMANRSREVILLSLKENYGVESPDDDVVGVMTSILIGVRGKMADPSALSAMLLGAVKTRIFAERIAVAVKKTADILSKNTRVSVLDGAIACATAIAKRELRERREEKERLEADKAGQ